MSLQLFINLSKAKTKNTTDPKVPITICSLSTVICSTLHIHFNIFLSKFQPKLLFSTSNFQNSIICTNYKSISFDNSLNLSSCPLKYKNPNNASKPVAL